MKMILSAFKQFFFFSICASLAMIVLYCFYFMNQKEEINRDLNMKYQVRSISRIVSINSQ